MTGFKGKEPGIPRSRGPAGGGCARRLREGAAREGSGGGRKKAAERRTRGRRISASGS